MRIWALFVVVLALAVSPTNSQEDGTTIWNLGNVPFLGGCVVNGLNIPGLPIFDDPWILNAHCNTYNGSVGCFKSKPTDLYGLCICNQRDDSHADAFGSGICVGKVGAFCTTEHHNFFPDKLCTPNAYCKPLQPGPGRTVGKCECLYGYNEDKGRCGINSSLPEPERSTIPPTTTTEAPPKEDFKLPPLNLLIKTNIVPLDMECNPRALLNKTVCNTFTRTASCISKKCECSMQQDALFDDELQMCVGKQGTYCLGRKNALGYKACVKNANCVMEDGKDFEDGYSFGVCQCVYGYDPDDVSGLCLRNENISNPSTAGTIAVTTPTATPTTKGTTEDGGDGGSKTTPKDSSGNTNSVATFAIIFSFTCYILLL